MGSIVHFNINSSPHVIGADDEGLAQEKTSIRELPFDVMLLIGAELSPRDVGALAVTSRWGNQMAKGLIDYYRLQAPIDLQRHSFVRESRLATINIDIYFAALQQGPITDAEIEALERHRFDHPRLPEKTKELLQYHNFTSASLLTERFAGRQLFRGFYEEKVRGVLSTDSRAFGGVAGSRILSLTLSAEDLLELPNRETLDADIVREVALPLIRSRIDEVQDQARREMVPVAISFGRRIPHYNDLVGYIGELSGEGRSWPYIYHATVESFWDATEAADVLARRRALHEEFRARQGAL